MKSNKRCCWKLCCSNETVKRHSATQFEITVKWHSATQFEITVKWHSAENIVMTQCYTRCGSMSRPMMMSSISKRISRMSSLTVMRVEFTDSTRGLRSTQTDIHTHIQTDRQTDRHTDTAHSLWWESSSLIAHMVLDLHRHRHRHTLTHTDRQTDRQTQLIHCDESWVYW